MAVDSFIRKRQDSFVVSNMEWLYRINYLSSMFLLIILDLLQIYFTMLKLAFIASMYLLIVLN